MESPFQGAGDIDANGVAPGAMFVVALIDLGGWIDQPSP
jgi:hypothetical protein